MNTKTILSFIVAIVAILSTFSMVSAAIVASGPFVKVNDVELENGTITDILAAAPGETVPVTVEFTAGADLTDLKLKAWVDGYKSEVSASTSRFDVVSGSTYVKRLSLTLPSVEDMDANPEGLTLYVRIAGKTEATADYAYNIKMQRDAYVLTVLDVSMPSKASAGEIVALDVVLKNYGSRQAEDTFVTASIPELGISKRSYFGDLVSQDNNYSNDNEDARERRLYLVIPADAKSGDYTVQVQASNYDATSTTRKVMSITGLAVTNSTGTATPIGPSASKVPTSVVVLTVALVIIFIVLLIVLVVLLTKKPTEKVEDFGETSYY